MSRKTGTTIECDRYECDRYVFRPTEDDAAGLAQSDGWELGELDYCDRCVEIRAARKKPADCVPEGVTLYDVFGAAEAAGFEVRWRDEDKKVADLYCCGVKSNVSSMIGIPYGARCGTCKNAIAYIFGPSFSGGTVAFPDSDKVDVEDPVAWVIVTEYERAAALEATP